MICRWIQPHRSFDDRIGYQKLAIGENKTYNWPKQNRQLRGDYRNRFFNHTQKGWQIMQRVLVLGAGPQARVIPDIASSLGDIELLGFVDWEGEREALVGGCGGFPRF